MEEVLTARYLPRIPQEPPQIPALELPPEERPLWSVMIPVYNCAGFLEETLRSVLAQDPGPELMQVEVVDDASTDTDVEALVARLGGGRVGYYRQPVNVGSLRNFETCLLRSRGHLVHLLHGDDKVLKGFYRGMERLFRHYPSMGAAFCRYRCLDDYNGVSYSSTLEQPEQGLLDNWLERLARQQRVQTPAMVVRRSVYECLGGFYGVHYGEDWEMWLRIAAHYPVGYLPEVLAVYRMRAESISDRYMLTGQNIRDLKKVMAAIRPYFTDEKWMEIRQAASRTYGHYAINSARRIWGRMQDKKAVLAQLREAFSLRTDPYMVYQAGKICVKMIIGRKK